MIATHCPAATCSCILQTCQNPQSSPLQLPTPHTFGPGPVQGMQCSATIIQGEYTIHWTPKADGVNITCLASGSGYVGLGWTATPSQMVGSHAVIGWINNDASQNVSALCWAMRQILPLTKPGGRATASGGSAGCHDVLCSSTSSLLTDNLQLSQSNIGHPISMMLQIWLVQPKPRQLRRLCIHTCGFIPASLP